MTAKVAVLNLDQSQLFVTIVMAKEKLDLIKAFLQFNKHARSVVVTAKQLVKLAQIAEVTEKFKVMKMFQLKSLKALTMEPG
jgi:hypothetical protein